MDHTFESLFFRWPLSPLFYLFNYFHSIHKLQVLAKKFQMKTTANLFSQHNLLSE